MNLAVFLGWDVLVHWTIHAPMFTRRMFPIRLEAIASRLEAITSGLEVC